MLFATTGLALALIQAGAAPAAAQARPEIAAEVEKGVRAYNAQDAAFYETTLAADATYIADDGQVFAGKDRFLGLFKRIFAREPKPRLEISNMTTGGRGGFGWARFDWTLSGIERARPGVATAVFMRDGGAWRLVSLQNTPKGHAMRPAAPRPASQPAHQH
jgi:uncharacterized protein (TIGR02246 family)